jgi:hypothetical protein
LTGERAEKVTRLWQESLIKKTTEQQQALTLQVRDNISKLTETVLRLRGIQKQITLRKEILKDNDAAKDLLKESDAFGKKLSALEEKLHNAKSKISYDIFALRGGAVLYSQLAWLLANVSDGDAAPTQAQKDLAAELEKQLTAHVAEFEKLAKEDVAKLNESAKKLGVPELYVPPVKPKKDEPNPSEKK